LFSGSSKTIASVLLAAALFVCLSDRPLSHAESVPEWLAAAGRVDTGHLGGGSAAVVISSRTDFTVDVTGKFNQIERTAMRVLNRRSAERYLEAVGFENNEAKVISIQTWAISPSGHVTQSAKKDLVNEAGYPGFVLYSDDRVKKVVIPGAEDGGLVGYEIVTQGRILVNGESFAMEGQIPYRSSDLHVSAPSGSIRWFVNHPDRVQVVSQSAANAEFHSENRPAIPEEDDAPPVSSLAATVTVNYDAKGPAAVQSWEEAGRDYHVLFDDGEKPSSELSAQVDTLSGDKAGDLAKLDALYSYVSRKIRYVAIEIGKGGYQPHQAADVFRYQYGDCKDKANLLITMLNKVGIRAYPALVGTRGDIEADPAVPTLTTFDHMIVALPVGEGLRPAVEKLPAYDSKARILWIDPTSEADPLGNLPEMDQGVFALIAYPDHGDLRKIPEAPVETNGAQYNAHVRLQVDGAGSADVEVKYLGARNTEMRYFYRERSQAEILKVFENRLANYVNSARFERGSISGVEDSRQQIREAFSFKGDFSSTSAGDSWFFQPLFLSGISRPEYGPRPRKLPLDFGTPRQIRGTYRIELPIGMRIANLPGPTQIKSEFGELDVTYSLTGNDLVVTLTRSYVQSRIAPEQYAAFREFLNACLRAEMQRIRLVKTAS
jgi:transglutaminase superfamily protein/uncharacterized protein DUF3857